MTRKQIKFSELSIDETRPALFHYEMGHQLMALREEGVFIIGSGNIVHNLPLYNWKNRNIAPYEWAVRFEKYLRERVLAGDDGALIHYEKLGEDALLSVPIPDHYLPFLYILGLRKPADQVTFPVRGVDGGSVSMLAVQMG
jgi:4,5-DOPA dioxygenase extradiol